MSRVVSLRFARGPESQCAAGAFVRALADNLLICPACGRLHHRLAPNAAQGRRALCGGCLEESSLNPAHLC